MTKEAPQQETQLEEQEATTEWTPAPEMTPQEQALIEMRRKLKLEKQHLREMAEVAANKVERTQGKIDMVNEALQRLGHQRRAEARGEELEVETMPWIPS